jgi:hypothetical protein
MGETIRMRMWLQRSLIARMILVLILRLTLLLILLLTKLNPIMLRYRLRIRDHKLLPMLLPLMLLLPLSSLLVLLLPMPMPSPSSSNRKLSSILMLRPQSLHMTLPQMMPAVSDCQPNAPSLGGVYPFDVGVHLNKDTVARPLCYLESKDESSDDDSVLIDLSRDWIYEGTRMIFLGLLFR